MGCTSSVPSTADTPTTTTGNLENNVMSDGSALRAPEPAGAGGSGPEEAPQPRALPGCGADSKQTPVARRAREPPADDQVSGTDSKDNEEKEIDDKDISNVESLQLNKSTSSLKDVAQTETPEDVGGDEPHSNDGEQVQDSDVDRHLGEIIKEAEDSDGVVEMEHNGNNADASTSPTQSEASRATRWEALADVAAQLPPSLAVDPLTGQIYSLTK